MKIDPKIFLDAAELLLAGQDGDLTCNLVTKAERRVLAMKGRTHSERSLRASTLYGGRFRPGGRDYLGFWMSEVPKQDREAHRLTALCLMAAIARTENFPEYETKRMPKWMRDCRAAMLGRA